MIEQDLSAQLALSYGAMNAAQYELALSLAKDVYRQAETRGDRQRQGDALVCLSHRDRILSKYRRAHDSSLQAAKTFALIGDVAGEAVAQTTIAHVASTLGRNEDAVEAAILGLRLTESLAPCPQQVLAHNYLGVAYLWSQQWDRAQAAFEAAIAAATALGMAGQMMQPYLNLYLAEGLRLVVERCESGGQASAERVAILKRRFEAARDLQGDQPLINGTGPASVGVWHVTSAIYHGFMGDAPAATAVLREALVWLDREPQPTWLHALFEWGCVESALASGDTSNAELHAQRMVDVSTRIENEQLAIVGHLLASHIAERAGEQAKALEWMRRLNKRRHAISLESIEARHRAVQWRLELRRSETALESLQTVAHDFERLSLQDSLTGIGNRRLFDQQLRSVLLDSLQSGLRISLALIDVDQFKQVNDRYSHQVGDQVLVEIARQLTENVRDCDLAARLAGDEFVVILRDAENVVAEQVCQRIGASIAGADWGAVADGLSVTVSIGLAHAQRGETADALMLRSDLAMYRAKPADPATAVALDLHATVALPTRQ